MLTEKYSDELQVIIVNDGSLDATADIAERYCKLRPDTFSIIHKENGGHGSCINIALPITTGKYLKIIDSDDWVVNLDMFLDMLCKSNADVVINPFSTIDMVTGKMLDYNMYALSPGRVYSMKEVMALPKKALSCFTFHGITYKTEAYLNSNTQLLEKIFYEDQQYSTQPFCAVGTVLPLDFTFYQYLIGNATQSVAYSNQVKRLWQQEDIIQTLADFYSNSYKGTRNEIREYFSYKISECLLAFYVIALVKNPEKKGGRQTARTFRASLAGEIPEIIHNTSKKYYIALLMNYLGMGPKTLDWLKGTMFHHLFRLIMRK
jgi:glycosyltransferase involved in cell wall biosynthesis